MANEYNYPRKIIQRLHMKIKLTYHPLYTHPEKTNREIQYKKIAYNTWLPKNITDTLRNNVVSALWDIP